MPRLILAFAFVMLVALASFACSRDSYIDDVADIQDDLIEAVEEQLDDFVDNSEQCEQSLFSGTACDFAIANLVDMSIDAQSARRAAGAIDPPDYAATWHGDYLSYLDDSFAVFDDIARALAFGNEEALDRAFADFDSVNLREDDLMERFTELQ